jgi:hypothetical protein
VTYGLELMMAVFSIVQGLMSSIMSASGIGGAAATVLPESIKTAIENTSFWNQIPLWAVTLIGGLIITVLSFVMIMSVYGRFFRLYIYTAIAPVPLSSFAGEPSQSVYQELLRRLSGGRGHRAGLHYFFAVRFKPARRRPQRGGGHSGLELRWGVVL